MKIDVKKLAKGKVGNSSTTALDEEVVITDAITAPVQGQVVLTKTEQSISAAFDITVQVNINWEEGEQEATRHQIPLSFTREYLLHSHDENILAVREGTIDTDLAITPEVKINLPIQAFNDEE